MCIKEFTVCTFSQAGWHGHRRVCDGANRLRKFSQRGIHRAQQLKDLAERLNYRDNDSLKTYSGSSQD
ncbi:hypothetical protein BGZ60DRAFT_394284 [Tricladium varicosporioides]|nr:hypothetical protein BGZ60DRAFT_394284 [Hymenoscyphus varicosporioides]